MKKETSQYWWWFDSHNKGFKRSPWLQSTLSGLDEKTKAMLKLIEEDADSFAKRAEMYYKKRPEMISMVVEFYRAHRSLAERYDQVKSDHGTRLPTTFGSPFMSIKHHKPEKVMSVMGQTYNSYSESSDTEEYAESEVDDPEREGEIQIESEIGEVEDPELANETQVDEEIKEDDFPNELYNDVIMKLSEEIETLKEKNKRQKDQLKEKDEEKKEVIRQLSMAVGVLKDENSKLRKHIARDSPKKLSPFEFYKLKGGFFGKLFSGSSESPATYAPL